MGVVGDALPVELQVAGVLGLIDEFAEEEVDELVEGVFAAGDIVLAEDGGEAVVLLLLVAGGDGMEVGGGVFVLADVVGLDAVLKDAAGGVVVLVGVAPDGEAVFDIGGVAEAAEEGIFRKVFFIVAVGDDVAGVAEGTVLDEGGVEAEKLGLADLLGVAEKLVAIAQGVVPGFGELATGSLALDEEEGFAEIGLFDVLSG